MKMVTHILTRPRMTLLLLLGLSLVIPQLGSAQPAGPQDATVAHLRATCVQGVSPAAIEHTVEIPLVERLGWIVPRSENGAPFNPLTLWSQAEYTVVLAFVGARPLETSQLSSVRGYTISSELMMGVTFHDDPGQFDAQDYSAAQRGAVIPLVSTNYDENASPVKPLQLELQHDSFTHLGLTSKRLSCKFLMVSTS